MKAFFIILLLDLYFKSPLCKTVIYQFICNYNNIIYNSPFDEYLPSGTYYGKLEAHRRDEISAQFRFRKNTSINLEISVALFDHDPTDSEIIDYTEWKSYSADIDTISSSDYDIYKYPAQILTAENNYIGIRFSASKSLNYIIFFAQSNLYNYIKDLDYNEKFETDMSIFEMKHCLLNFIIT